MTEEPKSYDRDLSKVAMLPDGSPALVPGPRTGSPLFNWNKAKEELLQPFDNPAMHQERYIAGRHFDRMIINWTWEIHAKQKALAEIKKLKADYEAYKRWAGSETLRLRAAIDTLLSEKMALQTALDNSLRDWKARESAFVEEVAELKESCDTLTREYNQLKDHYDQIVKEDEE